MNKERSKNPECNILQIQTVYAKRLFHIFFFNVKIHGACRVSYGSFLMPNRAENNYNIKVFLGMLNATKAQFLKCENTVSLWLIPDAQQWGGGGETTTTVNNNNSKQQQSVV